LIDTIKLNSAFPLSQVTYNEEDILKFANHELFLAQVPSVLQYHEDYFSFRESVPLKIGKSRYDIPYRAIGQKVYDVYYSDPNSGGHLRKLNRIDSADKAFFQFNNNGYITPAHYFFEANQVCLTTDIGEGITGELVFVYYLRPNNLVLDERAAVCSGFSKDLTITDANIVAGDKIVIGGIELIAGTNFTIGVSDSATAASLVSAINSTEDYTAVSTSNIVTIYYELLSTSITTTNTLGLTLDSMQGIEFDSVPDNIKNSSVIDFLKKKGGHRTYKIDVKLGKNVVSATTIKFKSADVPEDFEIEDYICLQFECIIPQIPSDLHSLLAERTVARILEAQGDLQGLQTANGKISQLEAGQATLVQNRAEGSPRKVFNRNSLLRFGKGVNGNRTKV
jgi:hypothetical protein